MPSPAPIATLLAAALAVLLAAPPASGAPYAYVTNQGSHDVTVVDLATRQVVTTVPVGRGPAGVAASSVTGHVYVGQPEGGTINVIDMRSQQVVDTLDAGGGPLGLAVSPDGKRLLAADWSRNRVLLYEHRDRPPGAKREHDAEIEVGRYPAGLVVDSDNRTAYAVERDDDHVAVLDLEQRRVRERIAVGKHPFAATLDAARRRLYVLNVYSDDLSVVDLRTLAVIATVAVGKAPYGAALSSDGKRLFVTNQREDSVSVVDAETLRVVQTLEGFGYPEGIAADGDNIYVVNWMDDALSVLDAASGRELGRVSTGQNSRGFGAFIGAPTSR